MLPVPAFVALVLSYLALRTALSEGRSPLVALLGACALQSLLVTLAGGYGIEVLRPVLPVTATIVPPLAWITFEDALVRRRPRRRLALHAAAPAVALVCRVAAPSALDAVVPLVFAGYGGALLLRLRDGADMPLARLGAGRLPAALWRGLGWALVASAVVDVLIAAAHLSGGGHWTGWLVTISSSLVLLLLGVLSVSPAASGPPAEDGQAAPVPRRGTDDADADADTAIVARLDALLSRERLHLDPNLTLARLARRLRLPDKRLSGAVNRATGANVSRYVNSWRIRHARARIEEGASVTEAMLDSGFNTKSNFNREFLRDTGVPPSRWRREGTEAAHPPS